MKTDWFMTPLGEVLTERQETPSIEHILSGEIPIVSKISFDDGRIEFRDNFNTKTGMILIGPGDLVVSGINAAKGAIAIYDEKKPEPIAATIHYASYIPNKEKIDIRYLWWFLRSNEFREILNRNVPGGIKTELKAKRFLPIPIPLPPLSEQQRIVAKIDQLAAKIEEAETLRQGAEQKAFVFLDSATTQLLQQIDTQVYLGDELFEIIYRYPTFYNITYTDDGVGLLKISNLTQSCWDIDFVTQTAYISPETSMSFPRTVLESGDLVMAARGATIGKTAYVTPEFGGFNINANLLRLKPNPKRLDGRYFWYFIKSHLGQSQFRALVTSTAKETITVPKLKRISIPLPNLKEQRRIVSYLDALRAKADSLKQLQEQTAAELDALLPSILEKAFKGEL